MEKFEKEALVEFLNIYIQWTPLIQSHVYIYYKAVFSIMVKQIDKNQFASIHTVDSIFYYKIASIFITYIAALTYVQQRVIAQHIILARLRFRKKSKHPVSTGCLERTWQMGHSYLSEPYLSSLRRPSHTCVGRRKNQLLLAARMKGIAWPGLVWPGGLEAPFAPTTTTTPLFPKSQSRPVSRSARFKEREREIL